VFHQGPPEVTGLAGKLDGRGEGQQPVGPGAQEVWIVCRNSAGVDSWLEIPASGKPLEQVRAPGEDRSIAVIEPEVEGKPRRTGPDRVIHGRAMLCRDELRYTVCIAQGASTGYADCPGAVSVL
jgi:hypothetical protein